VNDVRFLTEVSLSHAIGMGRLTGKYSRKVRRSGQILDDDDVTIADVVDGSRYVPVNWMMRQVFRFVTEQ